MNALIFSAAWGVLMMFSGIIFKQKKYIRYTALLGIVLLAAVNILEMYGTVLFRIDTWGMLAFDRFALVTDGIIFISAFLYFLLSAGDMEDVGINYAEYFSLVFFILCGITITSSFRSLLTLFLGIEIISIPLYILTGADKQNLKSNEASLKYFLLGAFSTGIMLMGIALVYGALGTFDTRGIGIIVQKVSPLLTAGMLLLLFSMAFKVSAAPFHFWTPDVYDGAPTVFTSFMASIVKAAVFIAFIRLFDEAFWAMKSQRQFVITLLILATLLIGNITAVFQQSVKRMLAYSSIAQAGFMLFAVYALNDEAKEGILLYISAYSLATIGLFAVLIKMKDYSFEGFNGFAKQQPIAAAAITVFLFSLAGIPLTGGFLSKFYMLKSALDGGGKPWLVIFAVIMAAVSIYYYFRIIQCMYFKQAEGNAQQSLSFSPLFKVTLACLAALLILLGIFPGLVLGWYYF